MYVSSLQHGIPEDIDARDSIEQAVYRKLEELKIDFDRADHDEAATMELCRNIEKTLEAPIPKNLFLCNRQKTAFYLLLISGQKPFKTKYLSSQINSARLSFASPEEMESLLHVRPGSASVFSLMNDTAGKVQLLVDSSVGCLKRAGFHPCRNTSTVAINMQDLWERFLPAVSHTPQYIDLPEETEPDV